MSPIVEPSPEAYRSVLALRVVRRFQRRSVPEEELAAILEAGRWTGSSKNRQGWRFIVVSEEDGRRALADAGRFATPIQNAPVTVALVKTPDGNDFDIGRAAQNLMLAASARGLGSCPVTLHLQDRARRALGLPEGHDCKWAIALGYPDEDAERESRRRSRRRGMSGRIPLDDLVRREKW